MNAIPFTGAHLLKAVLTSLLLLGLTAELAADQVWDGVVSDSICGQSHKAAKKRFGDKKMIDAECARRCKRQQAHYVFLSKQRVYEIANQDGAGVEESVGLLVTLTGRLNESAITVSRIETRGPLHAAFLSGGLERVSRAASERVSSRLLQPASPSAGGNRPPFAVSAGYVSRDTISLQLGDGISVDAMLSQVSNLTADAVANRYHFGDQVAVTCQFLPAPVYDHHHGYEILEVKSIRFLRAPSRDELSRMMESHRFGFGENNILMGAPGWIAPDYTAYPPEAAGGELSKLDYARAVNLANPSKMPNFVADEIGKSYVRTGNDNPPRWKYQRSLESEITVKSGGESRRLVARAGEPWSGPAAPDFLGIGGWSGLRIRLLFDAHCPNRFEYAGPEEVRGKHVLAFQVTSPGGCFSIITGHETFRPAITGRALIADPGGRLVQFTYEAKEFPSEFPLSYWKEEASWDDVKIGDSSYLLPAHLDILTVWSGPVPASGQTRLMTREYGNYHHFEASSDITFR